VTDDVVITGLGTLGSFGLGASALRAALARGMAPTSLLPDPARYRREGACARAALCGHLDLSAYVDSARGRRMSLPSRMAVAAARMALLDAGLPPRAEGSATRAVAMATTFGAGVFTEKLLVEILDHGPRTASPFLFTDCVANAPAGQIAIDAGATGANATIVQREAGPLLAVIEGAREVRAGRAEACLAGHVDEIGVLVHAVLDRMRALCPADADGEVRPRPFSAQRRGFLAGEGSTVLVLEGGASARARDVPVLARLRASARAFDPSAPRADWGTGASALAARLSRALAKAGLGARDLDAVVSGASGSVRGDALEAHTLRTLFGSNLPPVFVPKAVTGEYGGGHLAAAVLLLLGAPCASVTPRDRVDPALGITPHQGALPANVRRVLVSALAAGGAAAWLVLER
jgi:3-oxoacyl-[acyl-carrier-protein] synthase II